MEYSLYELYKQSSLTLHEVRTHYLEHFYYRNHSRKDAEKVLKTVVGSAKVGKLLEESARKKKAPTYEDFLSTVCSILRLMLRSDRTLALATIDSALRWDIEINREQELCCPTELMEETIKVFKKYDLHEEMTEEEYKSLTPQVVEVEEHSEDNEEQKEERPQEAYRYVPRMKTWSIDSFSETFGKLYIKEYANGVTGDLFRTCVFIKGKSKVFVSFSSRLGELTMEEIEEMKEDLVVVQLPTKKYCLAKTKGGAKRWGGH